MKDMNELVVVGGGGHAKVLISVLKKLDFRLVGYTDPDDNGMILEVPYLGTDAALESLIAHKKKCCAAIGLGKIDLSAKRLELAQYVRELGFDMPAIVSPAAVINEGVTLGAGTVVFDGVVINSGTTIADLCILNTNCTVEHDCAISDNVHVGPGATVSGGVTIGMNSMIGAGSTILQGLAIGRKTLLGAGSTAIRDLLGSATYVGCPARRIH